MIAFLTRRFLALVFFGVVAAGTGHACVSMTAPGAITLNYDPTSPSPQTVSFQVLFQGTCTYSSNTGVVAYGQFFRAGGAAATHLDLASSIPITIFDSQGTDWRYRVFGLPGYSSSAPDSRTFLLSLPSGQNYTSGSQVLLLRTAYSYYYNCGGGGFCYGGEYFGAERSIVVNLNVVQSYSLAAAGGGASLTMPFGTMTSNETQNLMLKWRGTGRFRVSMTSENDGAMKLIGTTLTGASVTVPYTAALNGRPISTLGAYLDSRSSGTGGDEENVSFSVTLGDTAGKRAGHYRDLITLRIEAAL